MWVTKDQKNSFLDWFENLICSKCLSVKTNGIMIRSLHMNLPVVIILILCFGTKWMVACGIVFIVCTLILFATFNGCILSMLEHRLCQDNFTISDPFLEYLSIDRTNKNRKQISGLFITCLLIVWISNFILSVLLGCVFIFSRNHI